ncbi:MAG: hypothetical protein H0U52_07050 [Chloroflexi bacterium]|nr:hypothetical protein [Chloroflexota bacterium]
MTPLLLGAVGLFAFVVGGLVLRTFGSQYRIARLLATTPRVTVAEANQLAADGRRAFVRIDGRIDAVHEFEDADHRPLVFRRVRLEARVGRGWRPFEDHRQVVPFAINEGLDTIAIDVDALGEGLVVVPRESIGQASDMPDRVPTPYGPETTIRARIEQLSSVEHATVLGYPVALPAATVSSGAPDAPAPPDSATPDSAVTAHLTAGRSRPLILTVLEPAEAMRILAGGDAERTRFAAAMLGAGAILVAGALVWALISALLPAVIAIAPGAAGLVEAVLAASTDPTAAAAGDPRSDGQGPGLIGTPGLAILVVAAIGLVTVAVTKIYVRLTPPPAGTGRGDSSRRRR